MTGLPGTVCYSPQGERDSPRPAKGGQLLWLLSEGKAHLLKESRRRPGDVVSPALATPSRTPKEVLSILPRVSVSLECFHLRPKPGSFPASGKS